MHCVCCTVFEAPLRRVVCSEVSASSASKQADQYETKESSARRIEWQSSEGQRSKNGDERVKRMKRINKGISTYSIERLTRFG